MPKMMPKMMMMMMPKMMMMLGFRSIDLLLIRDVLQLIRDDDRSPLLFAVREGLVYVLLIVGIRRPLARRKMRPEEGCSTRRKKIPAALVKQRTRPMDSGPASTLLVDSAVPFPTSLGPPVESSSAWGEQLGLGRAPSRRLRTSWATRVPERGAQCDPCVDSKNIHRTSSRSAVPLLHNPDRIVQVRHSSPVLKEPGLPCTVHPGQALQ